jgi:hypothetical protein
VAARRSSDPGLALAVLDESDRATVLRWLKMFGFEPHELAAAPALAQVVNMIACLRLTAQMPELGREAAFREAATTLGKGDLLRTWYRWQRNVVRQVVGRNDGAR